MGVVTIGMAFGSLTAFVCPQQFPRHVTDTICLPTAFSTASRPVCFTIPPL